MARAPQRQGAADPASRFFRLTGSDRGKGRRFRPRDGPPPPAIELQTEGRAAAPAISADATAMSWAGGTGFSRNASALLRSDSMAAPMATRAVITATGSAGTACRSASSSSVPVILGQVDVGQYQVPGLGTGSLQGDGRVGRVPDLEMAHRGEDIHRVVGAVGVVLHQEDAPSRRARIRSAHSPTVHGPAGGRVAALVRDGCPSMRGRLVGTVARQCGDGTSAAGATYR